MAEPTRTRALRSMLLSRLIQLAVLIIKTYCVQQWRSHLVNHYIRRWGYLSAGRAGGVFRSFLHHHSRTNAGCRRDAQWQIIVPCYHTELGSRRYPLINNNYFGFLIEFSIFLVPTVFVKRFLSFIDLVLVWRSLLTNVKDILFPKISRLTNLPVVKIYVLINIYILLYDSYNAYAMENISIL